MIQALLMAAALAAPTNTVDLDRMHVIYDAAKEVCPASYRTSKSGDEFITNVTTTADHLGYQPQERVLLMTFCTVYAQGVEAGVNAATAAQTQPQASPPAAATTTPPPAQPTTPDQAATTTTPSATPQPNGESTAPVQGK